MKKTIILIFISMIMLVCSACGGSSADENTETTGVSTESSATQVSTYTAYYEKDWGEDPRIWEIQGVFAEGTSPVSDAAPLPLRVFYVTEDNTDTLLKDLYPGDYAYVGAYYLDEYGSPMGDYDAIEPYGHFEYDTIDDEMCTVRGGYYENLPKGTWFFGSVCFSDSFYVVVGDHEAAQNGTVPEN